MSKTVKTEPVSDALAERLENQGIWRRAAARWLVVMQQHELTSAQRDWLWLRRQYCQSRVTPVPAPEKLDISRFSRAASAAQAQMGIDRPNGAMFRTFPPASDVKCK